MFILVFSLVLLLIIPIVCVIHYKIENLRRIKEITLEYDDEIVMQGDENVGYETERIQTLSSYKKN